MVRSELHGIDPTDTDAIFTILHLQGVINEALCLIPSATTGDSRITRPNGLLINGTFITPFTKVAAPKYVIMRTVKSSFLFPNDFISERWYSRPELILDEHAFRPFDFGTCFCHTGSFT
ncbi:hypothetical protein F4810DRAFT_510366 [Camillea tinctor]|nr:hypothetical protein F4810DRAFT_510366 [Camillea tinctor]